MSGRRDGARPSVTVLRHHPSAPGARLTRWLGELGVDARTVPLDAGAAVPAPDELGDGLIVLGGTMNALEDDAHPHLARERALLAQVVDDGLPVFGVCLGHQLLGVALGGRLDLGAAGGPERGVHEVTWETAAAEDPVAARAYAVADSGPGGQRVGTVLQLHDDALAELPPGATLLASSAQHAIQAFRVGSALGVQFHPEIDAEMMGHWAGITPALAPDQGRYLAEAGDAEAAVARTARALAEGFAQQVHAST